MKNMSPLNPRNTATLFSENSLQNVSSKVTIRDDFTDLEPYNPSFTATDILLSANENNFGIPVSVQQKMLQAVSDAQINRYPDPLANRLRQEIAIWHGLAQDQVIIGNGGDELIFNLLLAFGGPQRTMLDCPPTFSIYALYAKLTGTKVVNVPRDTATFALDYPAVENAAKEADIVFLTTPNNPTGNLIDRDWIRDFAHSVNALVVVDEAYADFLTDSDSCIDLLAECENIAVLRTLSKAFALAGARCGYLFASPQIINALAAVRQPYSVNVLTQAAAEIAVKERALFRPIIEQIQRERERLLTALARIKGVQVWSGAANFILVKIPQAHETYLRLRDQYSILVRDFSGAPMLQNCLRISIGTPEENDALIKAITEIREGV